MLMRMKLQKLMSTDLVKVPVLNGLATLIRMLTGLISVKVVAAVIGPSGIALVGQLNNFSQILLSLSNGGITTGVTKYVSEHAETRTEYRKYIAAGFWITIVLTLIISTLLLIFPGVLSRYVFQSADYRLVFVLFGLTIIFYALNTLLIAVLNGFQEYRKYILVNISGSIVGLIFSVILALQFGILGALIASVTFQSVVFFLSLYIIRTSPWYSRSLFTGAFDKPAARKLAHYSLMAIVSALTVPTAQLFVRGYIVKFASVTEAGLWEGVNRISGMYLMIITTSLSVYFLPRLSQLKTQLEVQQEIKKVYKLLIPFLLISTLVIFLFRNLIIRILFTHEFAEMEALFATQLAADSIKICGWVLGYLLLAKAMTKEYVILELLNFVLLTGVNYFLAREYGAYGVTIGHAVVYTVYLAVIIFLLRRMLFQKQPISG